MRRSPPRKACCSSRVCPRNACRRHVAHKNAFDTCQQHVGIIVFRLMASGHLSNEIMSQLIEKIPTVCNAASQSHLFEVTYAKPSHNLITSDVSNTAHMPVSAHVLKLLPPRLQINRQPVIFTLAPASRTAAAAVVDSAVAVISTSMATVILSP